MQRRSTKRKNLSGGRNMAHREWDQTSSARDEGRQELRNKLSSTRKNGGELGKMPPPHSNKWLKEAGGQGTGRETGSAKPTPHRCCNGALGWATLRKKPKKTREYRGGGGTAPRRGVNEGQGSREQRREVDWRVNHYAGGESGRVFLYIEKFHGSGIQTVQRRKTGSKEREKQPTGFRKSEGSRNSTMGFCLPIK